MTHTDWPLWEVFVRSRRGLSHTHAGSLHAPDAELALRNARDLYTRRGEGVSLWVVPSSAITASSPDDEGPLLRAGRRQGLPAPDLLRHPRGGAAPVTTTPAADTVTTAAALALGDDALVLSHRLGEWAGHAPVLEEEVALANIALDLLGQARVLLSMAGDEDELAFLREERAFRNLQLVEQPGGDFAHTIARQLYFSVYQHLLYDRLAAGDGPFAPLAGKAVKEAAYHRDHAEQWTLRLGDGTEESHARMQRAVDALWRFTGEMFQPVEGIDGFDWPGLESAWREAVGDVLGRATLTVPDGPRSGAWKAGAGRQGLHTEPFGRMLAEMQHLHRSHPGATW
ncbi:ring-1,2-phenylacetyl-CoA epoxidase subunit PaaC [Streptomyces sp. di188]|nr:ring-1,2-phenylacetyl-CoA epoxidase subunit PaaC [Streptomyces sp. di188]